MVRFVARRLAAGVVLLFVISFLSYVLLSQPGTDVGRQLLGQSAPQELVDAKNHELGLDLPILTQYWNWLLAALQGDFGRSWFTSESVVRAIGNRLPVTLSLMIGVTLITALVSFAVGVWAGVRRGAVDRALQIFGVLGYALPGFLVTLVLVFAVQLRWFPAIGYISIDRSFTGWLSTVTLPIIALSIGSIAGTSQQVRGSVIEVMRQDYVRTLRARVSGRGEIAKPHTILRNDEKSGPFWADSAKPLGGSDLSGQGPAPDLPMGVCSSTAQSRSSTSEGVTSPTCRRACGYSTAQ